MDTSTPTTLVASPPGLPKLPEAPRYPCPFITTPDVERYLVPLYDAGWGISYALSDSAVPKVPTTRLVKRFTFPKPDITKLFVADVTNHITEPENVIRRSKDKHHPDWGRENEDVGVLDIFLHTHVALAPAGRQNTEDTTQLGQKRPGVTLRDIRWAILCEGLAVDYARQGLLEVHQSDFAQPTSMDLVHNLRPLPSQP